MVTPDQSRSVRPGTAFPTTHWSVVLEAGQPSSPRAHEALSELCRSYWYPLYAYARRRVGGVDEAQDLTQEFFALLLEKNYVAAAQPERGRFRSFLLTSFKHFLANEWDKAKAQKRGGGRKLIPLDFSFAESRYLLEPCGNLSPERLFEKQWVLGLLDHVLDRLRDDCARDGKLEQFDRLKAFIIGGAGADSYTQAASELGMTAGAAKVAAHRLRQRYRKLLREEIAQTVSGPDEVDEELRSLLSILRS